MKLAHPKLAALAIALLSLALTACASDREINSNYARLLYAAEHNDVRLAERILAEDPYVVIRTGEYGDTVLEHVSRRASADRPPSLDLLPRLPDFRAVPNSAAPGDASVLTGTEDLAALEMLLQAGMSQLKKDLALIDAQIEWSGFVTGFRHWRREEGLLGDITLSTNRGPTDGIDDGAGDVEVESDWEREWRVRLEERIALLRRYGAGSDSHSPVWPRPVGKAPDRLGFDWDHRVYVLESGWPVKKTRVVYDRGIWGRDYAAVWASDQGRRLVWMPSHSCGGYGAGLYLFDDNLKLIRAGNPSGDYFPPYALVEIRSMNPSLPEEIRGKWILVVPGGEGFPCVDLSKPIRFVPPREWHLVADEALSAEPNTFECSPVDWFDDDIVVDDGYWHENEPDWLKRYPPEKRIRIKDLTDLEIRIAEPDHPFGE